MIAIKFENGKVISYKYPCEDLEELRPTKEGFELYDWEGEKKDIPYLTERDGALVLDKNAIARDKQNAAKSLEINEIKIRLSELDKDINACTDGAIKAKTEEEYRTERIILRNKLRVLEGKEPLKEVKK